jgi:hypothetical protein
MDPPSSSIASSAAARAKAVPKTTKKLHPSSHSSPSAQQSPVSVLLAAQAPTISSDSEGSLDDIVFDNTGMFRRRVLELLANPAPPFKALSLSFNINFPLLSYLTFVSRQARPCPIHNRIRAVCILFLVVSARCQWAQPLRQSLHRPPH